MTNWNIGDLQKYKAGDVLQCIATTFGNVEKLEVGNIYSVVGIQIFDGNVLYAVIDEAGKMYHAIDVFNKIGDKIIGSTVLEQGTYVMCISEELKNVPLYGRVQVLECKYGFASMKVRTGIKEITVLKKFFTIPTGSGIINTDNKLTIPTLAKGGVIKEDTKMANTEIKKDAVNPNHYRTGKIECIEALESATVGKTGIEAVCTANIIKYLWRYENKNGVEDIKKAQWYLNKLLSVKGVEPEVVEKIVVKQTTLGNNPAPLKDTSGQCTKRQRGYIYGICASVDLDPRNLPSYVSPKYETRDLTEEEAIGVLDRLLAIRNFIVEKSKY